jgi:hypothetical protein
MSEEHGSYVPRWVHSMPIWSITLVLHSLGIVASVIIMLYNLHCAWVQETGWARPTLIFEVLAMVTVRSATFWDIPPCSLTLTKDTSCFYAKIYQSPNWHPENCRGHSVILNWRTMCWSKLNENRVYPIELHNGWQNYDTMRHVHKVSFPLVPQLANLILRKATAHTW